LLILIPVLALGLLTLGYFSWENYSKNTQKLSSQNLSSASLSTTSISQSSDFQNSSSSSSNQNTSQSNTTISNFQISSISSSIQNANSASLQVSNSSDFSTSSSQKSTYLGGEASGVAPLQADNEHDVVVLEECDLAIKYEKKYKIGELYGNADNFIQISCGKKDIKPPFNEITKIVGWEGTTPKITSSKNYKPFTQKMAEKIDKVYQSFKGYDPNASRSLYIVFEFENKYFTIVSNENNDLFDANILQLQFNSLAPSTPSVKL